MRLISKVVEIELTQEEKKAISVLSHITCRGAINCKDCPLYTEFSLIGSKLCYASVVNQLSNKIMEVNDDKTDINNN